MFDTLTNKESWNVTEQNFPQIEGGREKIKFLLNYAVLAPSSHNTQPWRFRIVDDEKIEIFADESRWLKIADADKREMFISIGCALENLLIAAAHFGLKAETEYFPQPGNENPAASVTISQTNDFKRENQADLFEFIPLRSTFHATFSEKEIPADVLRKIEKCCGENGINLFLTDDEKTRGQVEDLIVRSDAKQFADPALREELAYWIGQGVFGNSWLMAQIGSLAVAYLNLGKSTAKTDQKVLRSAPVLGLLTSAENDRISQVKTGQIFERIYLTARKFGLGIRPMSQIVQIHEHKEELGKLIPNAGVFSQQPFLLGYAEISDSHTPRRNIDEVLVS